MPGHYAAFRVLHALENILSLAQNWRRDEPIEPVVADIARAAIEATHRTVKKLSPREIEVLRLLAEGCTNNEIADRLHVSPATVKTHLERIFEKVGASDRAGAVAEGLRQQLIQ